jgi:ribosomal protein S18 acetylase RimI-like enzyme
MRHSLQIRAGEPSDADRLAVLAAQVWLHTYCTNGINGEVAHYVLSEFTAEKFSARLKDPEVHILVAECEQWLVGFAAVRFGASCPSSGKSAVELQTLYVQEHFIGQGIGRSLLEAAEAKARKQCGAPLWLSVNAQNARAIAFYARQGYSKVGTTYFVLGQGRYENHVLVGADA